MTWWMRRGCSTLPTSLLAVRQESSSPSVLLGSDFVNRTPTILDDFRRFDNDIIPLRMMGIPKRLPFKSIHLGVGCHAPTTHQRNQISGATQWACSVHLPRSGSGTNRMSYNRIHQENDGKFEAIKPMALEPELSFKLEVGGTSLTDLRIMDLGLTRCVLQTRRTSDRPNLSLHPNPGIDLKSPRLLSHPHLRNKPHPSGHRERSLSCEISRRKRRKEKVRRHNTNAMRSVLKRSQEIPLCRMTQTERAENMGLRHAGQEEKPRLSSPHHILARKCLKALQRVIESETNETELGSPARRQSSIAAPDIEVSRGKGSRSGSSDVLDHKPDERKSVARVTALWVTFAMV